MAKPEALYSESNRQPSGTFSVDEVQFAVEPGATITDGNVELKFEGDGSVGSTWVGLGVLRNIISHGRQALLVFNPDDKPVLPDNFK